MRKFLTFFLLLLFAATAVFSIFQICGILREYRAGEMLYRDAQQHVMIDPLPTKIPEKVDLTADGGVSENGTQPENTNPAEQDPSYVFPVVDFQALKEINPDVVGWIYIPDTNINYPVVLGSDNREYLYTMIDGTSNSAGSIFMDFRNKADMTDRHVILYGHNMKNKSMFHDICNYRNQEYYEAHPIGLLVTPDRNYYFEIVSAYVAHITDPAWQLNFSDDQDAHQWLLDAAEQSFFVTAAEPKPGDRMITLSTCSYEFRNARFVLVGILRESDP